MTEPIVITPEVDLGQLLPNDTFNQLLDWLRTNNVDPWRITRERTITITDDTITRHDVLGEVENGYVNGNRRDHGHQLQPGQEWTTEDEFAITCHQVTSPITNPMADHLHDAVTKAVTR
jgi:hypothetical protein